MKRTTKQKPNNGPANPRNRKEKKEIANKILEVCESAIMSFILNAVNKPNSTWADVDEAYEKGVQAQKEIHPDHKGIVLLAASNVQKAYLKVKSDMLKKEGRI